MANFAEVTRQTERRSSFEYSSTPAPIVKDEESERPMLQMQLFGGNNFLQ